MRRMRVRERDEADRAAVAAFLERHGSGRVARRGALEQPLDHPAVIAEARDGRVIGVATYVPGGPRWEILTLHARPRTSGIGTALVEAVAERARAAGARALWLSTTNDNVAALRFYQRRGFRLVALHAGAVDRSRAELKPEIPATGAHGIPLRDELELELDLD
jgi:ribosomal protein S18 acetylase RimI-like enzyme